MYISVCSWPDEQPWRLEAGDGWIRVDIVIGIDR